MVALMGIGRWLRNNNSHVTRTHSMCEKHQGVDCIINMAIWSLPLSSTEFSLISHLNSLLWLIPWFHNFSCCFKLCWVLAASRQSCGTVFSHLCGRHILALFLWFSHDETWNSRFRSQSYALPMTCGDETAVQEFFLWWKCSAYAI